MSPGELADLEARLHAELVSATLGEPTPGLRAITDLVRAAAPLLPEAEACASAARVLARMDGLGPLETLLADPEVTEIMVNGAGPVWVERRGVLERTEVQVDSVMADLLVQRVVAPAGLRVDRSSPLVEARLPDGSRAHAVVPPVAVDGPCLTIRRFRLRPVALSEFAAEPVVELLRWAVAARWNILVVGGTGAGKTTLLNALAGELSENQRIVTIEDTAELRLPGPHVVRLEARPANAEGMGEITIRTLVRTALRMRPDRIVVGEVRGPEALDMLQALNTGHDGSLSTCHANGPAHALRRIETMVLTGAEALPLAAVREQVAGAVDLVVHVAREPGGRRSVAAVAEVTAPDTSDPSGRVGVRLLADGRRVTALPRRPGRRSGTPVPC